MSKPSERIATAQEAQDNPGLNTGDPIFPSPENWQVKANIPWRAKHTALKEKVLVESIEDNYEKLIEKINASSLLDSNGKIKPEKLSALALSETVVATETDIASFAANSANYTFQNGDFIAVPDEENYKLYLYTGDNQTDVASYLPTGISNVAPSQVQGLQLFIKDIIADSIEIVRNGNDLSLELERTTTIGDAANTFWQILGLIRLSFDRLELNATTQQALPNTLTNDGFKLIYTDANGISESIPTTNDLKGEVTTSASVDLSNGFGKYNTTPQSITTFSVNLSTAIIGGSALVVVNSNTKPTLPSSCTLINDSWASGVDVAYHFLCVSANTVHVKTYIV